VPPRPGVLSLYLLRVADEETEQAQPLTAPAASERHTNLGGWHGLDAYRVQQRAARLARHHYRDTAAMLEEAMAHGEPEPLVIGGHDEGVRQLLASLPPALRECFAGSFAADVRTLTPARARELAAPLVTRWATQRAERLAEKCSPRRPAAWRPAGCRHA